MNFVNELCNLHEYIKKHFEGVEFISAETPNTKWNNEKVYICFISNEHHYKYALTDETQEEKAE